MIENIFAEPAYFIGLFLLCVIWGGLISFFWLRMELRSIVECLRLVHRQSGIVHTQPQVRTQAAKKVWRAVLTLIQRNIRLENERSIYDDAFVAGLRLVGETDSEGRAAEVLLQLLHQYGAPEVLAAAVIVADAEGPRILATQGVQQRRIEQALCMLWDEVSTRSREEIHWGFCESLETPFLDFRSLGVGRGLFVALGAQHELNGIVWLGIREQSSTMSNRRMRFLFALIEHGAASFQTARRVRMHSEDSLRERDFLLGMSHDLKAPGTKALYALRDVLEETEKSLPEHHAKTLKIAEEALEEQMKLLRDLFEVHRVNSHAATPTLIQIELAQFVREHATSYESAMRKKGLSLVIEAEGCAAVRADPNYLKRILDNLIFNAIKYTHSGTISIRIRDSKEATEVVIEDTGCGVPEDERRELFQRFFRAKNVASCEGVGLGLMLVKSFVDRMGGYVWYEPAEGGGSIFGLGLQTEVQASPHASLNTQLESSILVIDDDPATCRTFARYLRDIATKIVPAGSVQEARELLEVVKPDLVVSDLSLQDGSLLDLLPELEFHVPILVVSGSALDTSTTAAWQGRSVHYLLKPVSRETLVSEIARMLIKPNEPINNQLTKAA